MPNPKGKSDKSKKHLVIQALPGYVEQIAKKGGMSSQTAMFWIQQLYNAQEIYISEWIRPNKFSRKIPVYSLGSIQDNDFGYDDDEIDFDRARNSAIQSVNEVVARFRRRPASWLEPLGF